MGKSVKSNPNFRRTAAGAKLGRILFSKNSQHRISPAEIVSLLRLAGLNIPPTVVVTADVAQIIIAGGMLVDAAEAGASTVGAYASPTAAVIMAVMDILTICGLVDSESSAVQITRYGTEAAVVASSLGANVAADIALVLDTYQQVSKSTRNKQDAWMEFFTSGIGVSSLDEMLFGGSRLKDLNPALQANANLLAKQNVYKVFTARYAPQAANAAGNFLDFHNGKKSVFEFMGTVAENDPLVFYNYFPELKVFLPPALFTVTSTARLRTTQIGGIFSLARRDYDVSGGYSQTWETTEGYTREQIISSVINYYMDQGWVYRWLSSMNGGAQTVFDSRNGATEKRIEMGDLACLSLFYPYFDRIDTDIDYPRVMENLKLTPFDLGYSFVEDMAKKHDIFPSLKEAVLRAPAVTMNGIEYFTPVDTGINKAIKEKQAIVEQLIKWDMTGDIANLAKNKYGAKMLRSWGSLFEMIDLNKNILYNIQETAFGVNAVAYAGEATNYQYAMIEMARSTKNYFSLLSVAHYLKNDRYISSLKTSADKIDKQVQMITGLSMDMEARFKKIQFLSVARKMNANAKDLIAYFFGTTSDKIKYAETGHGELGYVL